MIPSFVPALAQDLIRGMIDVNPGTRLTVSGRCEGWREEWEMIFALLWPRTTSFAATGVVAECTSGCRTCMVGCAFLSSHDSHLASRELGRASNMVPLRCYLPLKKTNHFTNLIPYHAVCGGLLDSYINCNVVCFYAHCTVCCVCLPIYCSDGAGDCPPLDERN